MAGHVWYIGVPSSCLWLPRSSEKRGVRTVDMASRNALGRCDQACPSRGRADVSAPTQDEQVNRTGFPRRFEPS